MTSEADTCRTYVLPALYAAGWTDDQIREQVSFTPGRIIARKAPGGLTSPYVLGGFLAGITVMYLTGLIAS
jgi:type I site-specific restriction endonuclease